MSLYTVLDIGQDASDFELEQAFRSRSLQFLTSLDSRDHREFYAVSDAFQSEYSTNCANCEAVSVSENQKRFRGDSEDIQTANSSLR